MTLLRSLLLLLALLWPHAVLAQTENCDAVVAHILAEGDTLVRDYRPEGGVASADSFSRLYFDVFESSGLEFRVGAMDKDLLLDLETRFSQVIALNIRQSPRAEIEAKWSELKDELGLARALIASQGDTQGFWSTAVQSFLILIREGVEAMLVIAALVAYLRRSGAGDKVPVIWYACGAAVLASAGAAYLLTVATRLSGADRVIIEGVTLMLAAAMLFYVSAWLLAKRETRRWQGYIAARLEDSLSTGSLLGLALTAFLAVFREGAETVLFYQALMAGAPGQGEAILSGLLCAAVALLALYLAVRAFSIKIPLKPFFTVTAAVLFVLAVSFAGKGVLELQIAGWLGLTPLTWAPSLPLFGIFPSLESIGLQVVLLLALIPIWFLIGRKTAPEADAKSAK